MMVMGKRIWGFAVVVILIDEGLAGYLGEGVVMDGCAGGEYVGGPWADEWDDDDLKNGDDAAGDDELTDT